MVSSHVYLDTMIQNLNGPSKVFNFSGQLYADATISLTFDTEIGPDITLFSYDLARVDLLDYDPPPAPSLSVPLVVIDSTDQHTLLLDPSKMAGGNVTVQPFENFTVTSDGTYVADGIRVDYPNEIDLYVERKDGTTTDYYNMIGVNGVVPSGTSVSISDPFRLFKDEGVPDPDPPQTKPGVLLVGGSSVVYGYSDSDDGSHANVLLAGGYGSNTLVGGSMEFGNFIPADRLDQAKAIFGDTSGFDATGANLINSAIDADVAPADPTGIIGATMTASRGGLMLGGPGANSFIATGPGNYDMIGGTWVNTFDISPSFNDVPATYQIDGGPYGQSQLVVRVPEDENVTFENSTVPDKYDPTLMALAVVGNAGLSATATRYSSGAHHREHGVARGDRRYVGAEHRLLDFWRCPSDVWRHQCTDLFDVDTSGYFYDQQSHFPVETFESGAQGIIAGATYGRSLSGRDPDAVYDITPHFRNQRRNSNHSVHRRRLR